MKNKIIKLTTILMITMMAVIGLNINDTSIMENKSFAEVTVIGSGSDYSSTTGSIDADQFFKKLTDVIFPLAQKFARFFIFVAVIAIGFDLIKERKNKDKQKESLNSLIYLAVGAMIISGAIIFSDFIWGTGSSISKAPQQTITINV